MCTNGCLQPCHASLLLALISLHASTLHVYLHPRPSPQVTLALPYPSGGSVYDYVLDRARLAWVPWVACLDTTPLETAADFASLIVPTADTARYDHLLGLLIRRKHHALLVGPTGTGKTVRSGVAQLAWAPGMWANKAFLMACLRPQGPHTHCSRHCCIACACCAALQVYVKRHLQSSLSGSIMPLALTFSAQSSANATQVGVKQCLSLGLICENRWYTELLERVARCVCTPQDIIDGSLEKRRRGVYGAPGGKSLVVFVDDLGMPQARGRAVRFMASFVLHMCMAALTTLHCAHMHQCCTTG